MEYWRLMKTTLGLPRSLKHECVKAVVFERDREKNYKSRMEFNERIKTLRYHGSLLGSGWRYQCQWNMERILAKGYDELRRGVDLLKRMKMRYSNRE